MVGYPPGGSSDATARLQGAALSIKLGQPVIIDNERLTRGGQSLGDIAEADQMSTKYVGRVLQLALLAPDIVHALEQGEYPVELSATKLRRMVPLPMDWDEQRQLLGMA